jgi:hypothetical protein
MAIVSPRKDVKKDIVVTGAGDICGYRTAEIDYYWKTASKSLYIFCAGFLWECYWGI